MFFKKSKKNLPNIKDVKLTARGGSILIESIVGISVAVIGMMGIFSLLSRSIAINKDVSQKLVATYLAAEGIETIKSLIDTNFAHGDIWNAGISDGNYGNVAYDVTGLPSPVTGQSTTKLLFDADSGVYNYTSGEETPFKRTIKISEISSDEIKVVSDVEWTDRATDNKISLEDHFFNWR